MLTRLNSLEEVDALIATGERMGDETARVKLLANAYYDASLPSDLDPFGDEYFAEIVKLHAHISGFPAYQPAKNELMAPYLRQQVAELIRRPPPLGDGIEIVGDYLMALGFIMKTIALAPGKSLLEYGPGGGLFSIFLARAGYDVSVVDIEPAYIDVIEGQCRAIGIEIKTRVGQFGDVPEEGKRYDAVLFFEAFHHCLNHNALLHRLRDVVIDDEIIVFAGEPINPKGSYWEPVVPFPWGPRCDVLSLCAMRGLGWMELGFRESYFHELLRRAGWSPQRFDCVATPRGTTYVARRSDQEKAPPFSTTPSRSRRGWLPWRAS